MKTVVLQSKLDVVCVKDFDKRKVYVTKDGNYKLQQVVISEKPKWAFVSLTNSFCWYNGCQNSAMEAIEKIATIIEILEFETWQEYINWMYEKDVYHLNKGC